MVLILRFLPIIILVMIAVLLTRQTSVKKTLKGNPVDNSPLLTTLSGVVGLFVLFVGAAEFIRRI